MIMENEWLKLIGRGKTRAGTPALPTLLDEQLGRTVSRLKGLATDPVQEGVNIVRQYLHDPTATPEENERKLNELALGMTGTPIKGVRPYGVAQEGAFYRVSPEAARRNAARTRGNLESGGEGTEVTGGASRGDVPEPFAGQTFQDLTASQNFPLEVADKYTRQHRGGAYSLPAMSESSLAKQSAIGRTFQLAATDNPVYKKAVFAAYKKKYPKVVEQAKAKDYDDLLEKSYLQLAKETERQFKELPINMSYHRAGEGNYRSSGEMLHDVHKNRHLYVFQGGDPHDFLNKIDPDTGLNTNEMFRAVHDFFGHAVHGTQFGPKGEELAWLAHSRMYSPLARLAMTSETRGQNSFVNYTPINAELKRAISQIEEELYEAKRRGRDADVQRLEQLKAGLFNEFQFAPQKSVLLPPEFTTKEFEGGMPSYIQSLIEPKAGTTTQSPLTHFSTSPDLMMTDPMRYGTGIAGEEASRLQGVKGAVRPRTYFYAGEPEMVTPESGLGPYRYRAEGESLYNIAEDPLSLRTLATEANRIPFTAQANAGLVRQAQAMADLERMIKEYGYEGYLQPGGQSPAAAVFTPKLVQRKADGGLTMATGGQAFPLQDDFEAEMERRRNRPRTRAGVPVEDTNVLGGALQGLGETLLGAGRGYTAIGLGGVQDLLNMIDLPQIMTGQSYQIPYGSEYFKENLPLKPTTQTGQVAQELGSFLPMDPTQVAKAGYKTAKTVGKSLAPTMADMMEAELKARGMMMGVAPEGKSKKFSDKVLESTTEKIMQDLLEKNPKLTPEEALKKAKTQAEKKLTWEREEKPALVKQYGPLVSASYNKNLLQRKQNTKEVVANRIQKAKDFLSQPTEPWTPPKPELQAFDRTLIQDALEGFPGVTQTAFPRDIPPKAGTSHVEELYTDPVNRELIKQQISRGLPLGGETFYASLYPIKQAALEAGIPAEKFEQWIHALAPASARNSIINETAVGQFLRDMHARGIPLTEENVVREMEQFKQKYGVGLPLMPVHRQGVANVLEGGQNLRDLLIANIPTNYKIPTYGTQKAGDFGKSVVLDVHEAAGQSQGSRYHPYFSEQGGFGNTEYNAGEQGMLGIAKEMGIPGGMAQAGRWFGGGELTGLKSPRGDALDILERQVAYTLKQQGIQPNPALIRKEILRQIKTGKGVLLPWWKKEAIPDVRETGLQRKEGGAVHMADGGAVHPAVEKFASSLPHPAVTEFAQRLADGGGVWNTMVNGRFNTIPDVSDSEQIIQGPALAEGGGIWKQLVKGAGNA